MTNYSRDPAYFGAGSFSYSRFNVYNSYYEGLLNRCTGYRSVTWRRAKWTGTADSTTGQVYPTFDEYTVNVVFTENGSRVPNFAGGFIVLSDGVALHLESIGVRNNVPVGNDQLLVDNKYYVVTGTRLKSDPVKGGFCFYISELKSLLWSEEN